MIRECADLQRAELAALPAERVSVLETHATRLVTLTGAGFVLTATFGPTYPLREAPDVRVVECADDELSVLQQAVERVRHAHVRCVCLIALLHAADDALARVRVAPPVAVEALRWADVVLVPPRSDGDAESGEFFGSSVQIEAFAALDAGQLAAVGESVTAVGQKLYCIGGTALKGVDLLPLVRVFDLHARTWRVPALRFETKLKLLQNHCAVLAAGSIFVFGGEKRDLRIRVLELATHRWWSVGAPPSLGVRQHASCTRVGDDVWIVGGHHDAVPRAIFVFNVPQRSFRNWLPHAKRPEYNLALMPTFADFPAVREHSATRVGRFLLIAGGVVDSLVSSAVFVIDTIDRRWCQFEGTQMRPRAGHAALRVHDDFVLLVGGRSADGATMAHCDVLNLATKTWSTRSAGASSALSRHRCAAIPFRDGRMLVAFGHTMQHDTFHRVTHAVRAVAPSVIVDVGLPSTAPRSTLGTTLLALLDSGSFSDLQFRGFRLHRVVLQARCPALLDLIERGRADELASDEAFGAFFQHVYGDKPIAESCPLRAESTASVQTSLGALFDDDERRAKYADVTFASGDETFRVHRLFASRAAHFERALGAGMREAQTGTIRVDDVEPASVRALLRFLYSDELVCDAEHAVEVLALADRCQLDALKKHAEALIESFYDFGELANVCDLVDIAQRYGAEHLRRAALNVLVSDFSKGAVLEHLGGNESLSEHATQAIRTAFWIS